jgi:hypothetical protein
MKTLREILEHNYELILNDKIISCECIGEFDTIDL